MRDHFELKPVAFVRWDPPDAADTASECTLEVLPEFAGALLGIKAGDRLQVLYWMHELPPDDRRILQAHPMGDRSRPVRGVFALRSPMRPNPIGSTVVEVGEVRDNELVVTGLDALDGSPVLDIKAAG